MLLNPLLCVFCTLGRFGFGRGLNLSVESFNVIIKNGHVRKFARGKIQ